MAALGKILSSAVSADDNPFGITWYAYYWHTEKVTIALFFLGKIKEGVYRLLRKAVPSVSSPPHTPKKIRL